MMENATTIIQKATTIMQNATKNASIKPYCGEVKKKPGECSTSIFLRKEGEFHAHFVIYNNELASYHCYPNYNPVRGNRIRHCVNGIWNGSELQCEVGPLSDKLTLFMIIMIAVLFVFVVLLAGDFIVRLKSKSKLRSEKARMYRMTRIRALSAIDSQRIRPFPQLDFVFEPDRDRDFEDDEERYQLLHHGGGGHSPTFRRGSASVRGAPADGTGYNVFQAFRPKINIKGTI